MSPPQSASQSPSDDFRNSMHSEYAERRAAALAMGGPTKLAKRKEAGFLNARERAALLLDNGSFIESGLFATSIVPGDRNRTPADGKVVGYGKIEGRQVALVSNDFTVMGASSSAINGRKIAQMKRVATQRGLPLIFLGESSGARMPDTMGARGMATMLGADPTQYQRMRETPWAAAVLGYCYGSSSWYTVLSDFSVMRKGAIMAVSSPMLASLAISEAVDPEALGGWKLHSEITGLVDRVVDTDEQALEAIRTFLGYLPSHHNEPPPLRPVTPGSGANVANLANIVPTSRSQVYDVRRVIEAVVDAGSMFEMKPRFGKVAVTALARIDGRTVGIVANNPQHKGGALDTDACEKITRFIVLCDSFNIPLVMLVDTPGFIIGLEAERRKAPGKIMNFMSALSLVTVPKVSVILRKSYGQAYLNMGGGRNSDEVAAWPAAEVSFMTPQFGAQVVSGAQPGSPEFDEVLEQMNQDSSVYDIASIYGVQAVILPQETRDYLISMLEVHRLRLSNGIGRHLMSTWPTTY